MGTGRPALCPGDRGVREGDAIPTPGVHLVKAGRPLSTGTQC